MARYEYTCTRCGEELEVEAAMSGPRPRTHRGCGGELKRRWNTPGISFKGGGFYRTDSRSKAKTS